MTIPDKPTDPENKYVITEKGKAFLTGQFSSDNKFHELNTWSQQICYHCNNLMK